MDDVVTAPALGEALRFLRLTGIFYCPSELSEPWGLALPPTDDCLWFHVVTAGSCTIEVAGGPPRQVHAGDLVVLPHGTGHRAWGTTPAPTPSVLDLPHDYVNERYAVLRHGGDGPRTDIVCGGVRLDHPAARHLAAALPELIHVESARTPRSDWLHASLGLMADETRHVRPGGDAVVSRLCDILVIHAIRTWLEHGDDSRTGWLAALRDPQIGVAVARVHDDPGRDWTVATLAAEVAMSRSSFSARFTTLVGEPVMRYVTRWRMLHALDLLETTTSTVAQVARLVGYESEAAFSRAFTRFVGLPPSAARTRPDPPAFAAPAVSPVAL
ncbi:MAG: AraC family transcriptional regulator [Acidimicrobiales bacterium]